jgi:hypothetical protein
VYQTVRPEHLEYARGAVAMYGLWPMLQTVRARIEEIAAMRKRTSAVMADQITYLAALTTTLAVALHIENYARQGAKKVSSSPLPAQHRRESP